MEIVYIRSESILGTRDPPLLTHNQSIVSKCWLVDIYWFDIVMAPTPTPTPVHLLSHCKSPITHPPSAMSQKIKLQDKTKIRKNDVEILIYEAIQSMLLSIWAHGHWVKHNESLVFYWCFTVKRPYDNSIAPQVISFFKLVFSPLSYWRRKNCPLVRS